MNPECLSRYIELITLLGRINALCAKARRAFNTASTLSTAAAILAALALAIITAGLLMKIFMSLAIITGNIWAVIALLIIGAALAIAAMTMSILSSSFRKRGEKILEERQKLVDEFLTLLNEFFENCPEANREDRNLILSPC